MKLLTDVLTNKIIVEHIEKGYKIIECPVCSNETFDDYFICPHCGWEFDNIVDKDVYSTTNKSTIKDFKKNL